MPSTAANCDYGVEQTKPEWSQPEVTVVSVDHTLNSGATTTDTSSNFKDS